MTTPPSNSARALVRAYALAALLGAYLGFQGFGAGYWEATLPLTPAARVGYALEHPLPPNAARDWTQLTSDIETLEQNWPAQDRPLLKLVLAAHGLDNQGQPRRDRVKQQCESLQFTRCDDSALELLQRGPAQPRSQP